MGALPSLAWQGNSWYVPLVLACCWNNFSWNQHFTLCQAEGQPKSELICGHNTISHPGSWAHCKLCYIISLRMTGGKIWAPVVLFHWYRFEGSSEVGHAILHASPADRGSTLALLYVGSVHWPSPCFRDCTPSTEHLRGYWVQQESHSLIQFIIWPVDRQHLILRITVLKNESKLELI